MKTKWIIKTNGLYVKSGKEDTPHLHDARRFDTEEKAVKFAHIYCSYYTICCHQSRTV